MCACSQIIAKGAAQAQGAAVCILHSETDDVWFNGLEFSPAAKRTLYLALRHSQQAVDIVIEEDVIAGAENGRFCAILCYKRPFHQDRLGTNIGQLKIRPVLLQGTCSTTA
jgi:hypothetical protein|eukprot:COSAG06_NODE_2935_length_6066_cov_74.847495_3_plen_111_part_00